MMRALILKLLNPLMAAALTILLVGRPAMGAPFSGIAGDSLNGGIQLENRSRHIRAMEIRAGFYSRILASLDPGAAEVPEIIRARDAALQAAGFSDTRGEDARNDFYIGWRIGGWCIRAGKVATWRSFEMDENSLPEIPPADAVGTAVEDPMTPPADEAFRGGPGNEIHVQQGMFDPGDAAIRSLSGTRTGSEAEIRIQRDPARLYLKLYEKGTSLFFNSSSEDLERIIALQREYPANADANFLLGRQYEQNGSLRLAVTFYTLAAELDPEDAAASLCAGRLFRRLGDTAKADRYLQRASELEKTSPERNDRDKQS